MNPEMLTVIQYILHEHGEGVFENMSRVNAVLLDLAPGMTRERILARDFIEIDGYNALLSSGEDFPLIKNKLVHTLTDTFSVERSAAKWAVSLFSVALGLEDALYEMPAPSFAGTDSPFPADAPALPGELRRLPPFAIGKAHYLAAAADGTVFFHGKNDRFQCDVSTWRNIVALAAGDEHTVGLRRDGTVLAVGSNTFDQCDVSGLPACKAVFAFGNDTAAIKADGGASATGKSKFDLSHFNQIKSLAKFPEGLFGIREDGRVMAARAQASLDANISRAYGIDGLDSENADEFRWAQSLTDAEQIISTYVNGSIVLKKDGCIYKMNEPDSYFAPWREVVSIVDLSDSFAILRSDGTVRVLAYDRDLPRISTIADSWHDIAAIFGKYKRLIGLTSNGRLLSACTDQEWLRRNGPLNFLAGWYPVRTERHF